MMKLHVQVVYPLGMTHTAMRAMSQARHVGKIVAHSRSPRITNSAAGLTIIPGGLGAVGAAVGTHLAAAGPRTHLVLLGRSGRLSAGNYAAADMLTRSGAEIVIAHCDASDQSKVRGLMQYLSRSIGSRAKLPMLAGLLQSGGVLEDAMLPSITLQVGCISNSIASSTVLATPLLMVQAVHVEWYPKPCKTRQPLKIAIPRSGSVSIYQWYKEASSYIVGFFKAATSSRTAPFQ